MHIRTPEVKSTRCDNFLNMDIGIGLAWMLYEDSTHKDIKQSRPGLSV